MRLVMACYHPSIPNNAIWIKSLVIIGVAGCIETGRNGEGAIDGDKIEPGAKGEGAIDGGTIDGFHPGISDIEVIDGPVGLKGLSPKKL